MKKSFSIAFLFCLLSFLPGIADGKARLFPITFEMNGKAVATRLTLRIKQAGKLTEIKYVRGRPLVFPTLVPGERFDLWIVTDKYTFPYPDMHPDALTVSGWRVGVFERPFSTKEYLELTLLEPEVKLVYYLIYQYPGGETPAWFESRETLEAYRTEAVEAGSSDRQSTRCPPDTACDPVKFDEYEKLTWSDEKARLDNLGIALQELPFDIGAFFVIYAGRNACVGEALKRGARTKNYLVRVRGIDPSRVVLIDGGYREQGVVQIWIVPLDVGKPVPFPTLKRNEVRVKNCTSKSNRSQLKRRKSAAWPVKRLTETANDSSRDGFRTSLACGSYV